MCSAPIFNKSGAPLTPTYTVSLAPELTQHQAGFAHGQQGLRLSWQLGGPAAGPTSRQGKAGGQLHRLGQDEPISVRCLRF